MTPKKNINNINYEDLKKISSLDENKINNLLSYIEDHKPISSFKELKNVNGISNLIIEELEEEFSLEKE